MNLMLSVLLISISLVGHAASQKVRRIALSQDQIAVVRTALGIATIIQVPDRPNSLVVGDTDAFKVEYLEQAITIKPLRMNARSNLYIYTDYRRFNVQLVTGPEAAADYVVYLDIPKEKERLKEIKPTLFWTGFQSKLKNESTSVQVTRLGRAKDGVLIIELKISGSRREDIDPKWFWLVQDGKTKPIHRLILSNLEIDSKNSIEGMIQVLKSDIVETSPLRLELRRKQTSFLTIPAVKTWK